MVKWEFEKKNVKELLRIFVRSAIFMFFQDILLLRHEANACDTIFEIFLYSALLEIFTGQYGSILFNNGTINLKLEI